MATKLFDEFESVSSKQWKQQIQFELKGADYNEALVWNSPEDIKVKPFYHFDEQTPPITTTDPEKSFSICQHIFVKDVAKSIFRAKDSVTRGAESIRFTIPDESISVEELLADFPTTIPMFIKLEFLSSDYIARIDSIATKNRLKVHCLLDPIGHLAKEGNWFSGKDNFGQMQLLSNLQNVSFLSADATLYQNAGANMVQQIAYALSHANEYLNRFPLTKPFVFEIAIGSNYFFEIAKLRALRELFELIAKEYGAETSCHIFATPSKRNKTIYDYNVNLLRTTTECMSAVLGGADTIANLPYDALYHKSNEFGERISRNQLLILKDESYFDKVGNAADGSYYIENLTQQLAEKALSLFKDIEANGGFLSQLGDGTIQRKISESADKEQQLFNAGKEVLLGTNKHPNKNDKMAHDLELFPFVKHNSRKTLITPIVEKRIAEKVEQERLEIERNSN